MKNFLIKLIELYQRTLSPDHGWFKSKYPAGYCKFTPTCSEYGKLAILKHGSIKGSALALWRVLRCNPWSKGGVDQV
jgi:putative membrane protein insertion efficiency factor